MRPRVFHRLGLGILLLLAGCNSRAPEQVAQNNQESNQRTMSNPSEASITPITGPIKYLALGDSTGSGVGAREGGYVARLFRRIAAIRADSKLVNLCVSGATTSDILREQLDRGVREKPNLITLGVGINDIGHGFSLDKFTQNYDEILTTLKSKTTATIVVTNIPEISSAPRIPEAMRTQYQYLIEQYNQRLEEVAKRHGVVVFDIYTITHKELPSRPELFSADGFHPSDEGYELWAEAMWPTMAKLVGG